MNAEHPWVAPSISFQILSAVRHLTSNYTNPRVRTTLTPPSWNPTTHYKTVRIDLHTPTVKFWKIHRWKRGVGAVCTRIPWIANSGSSRRYWNWVLKSLSVLEHCWITMTVGLADPKIKVIRFKDRMATACASDSSLTCRYRDVLVNLCLQNDITKYFNINPFIRSLTITLLKQRPPKEWSVGPGRGCLGHAIKHAKISKETKMTIMCFYDTRLVCASRLSIVSYILQSIFFEESPWDLKDWHG
jgi:hypothetical protein